MSGEGHLSAPRWPRRPTAYERALDDLREAERRIRRPIEDDDMGGATE